MSRKLAETSAGVQFHGYVSLAGEGVKDWGQQFWRERGCIGDLGVRFLLDNVNKVALI